MNYTDWCQSMFSTLATEGIWAVPRSGLVFIKDSEDPPTLRLQEVMPYTDGLPLPRDLFREYQIEDFREIKRQFNQAGIRVKGAKVFAEMTD